ncbi:hypothetical protein [Glutamicibacter sp. PS]|nr:hypothetical protein [Glutamicibacter sp. PS]
MSSKRRQQPRKRISLEELDQRLRERDLKNHLPMEMYFRVR